MTANEEYKVFWWDPDGYYHTEASGIDALTACNTAFRLAESAGARHGIVKRIIITDGGDCTVFEWLPGRGVTFPPKQESLNNDRTINLE